MTAGLTVTLTSSVLVNNGVAGRESEFVRCQLTLKVTVVTLAFGLLKVNGPESADLAPGEQSAYCRLASRHRWRCRSNWRLPAV